MSIPTEHFNSIPAFALEARTTLIKGSEDGSNSNSVTPSNTGPASLTASLRERVSSSLGAAKFMRNSAGSAPTSPELGRRKVSHSYFFHSSLQDFCFVRCKIDAFYI